MKRLPGIAAVVTMCLSTWLVAEQSRPGGVIEVRIAWPSARNAAQRSDHRLRLLGKRVRTGSLRQERRPELSVGRLVLVVVDHGGVELDRRSIPDPDVERLEVPDGNGLLRDVSIEHESTELLFSVPDLPGAAAVRIYQPRSVGDRLELALVGELSLSRP